MCPFLSGTRGWAVSTVFRLSWLTHYSPAFLLPESGTGNHTLESFLLPTGSAERECWTWFSATRATLGSLQKSPPFPLLCFPPMASPTLNPGPTAWWLWLKLGRSHQRTRRENMGVQPVLCEMSGRWTASSTFSPSTPPCRKTLFDWQKKWASHGIYWAIYNI